MKKQLNTTLTYVLSILGLLCCCFGGLGLFLSGPAFLIAHNKVKDATENPDDYEGDLNAMNTAKTIALVVLIINVLYFIYAIYVLFSGGYDEVFEKWNEMMLEIKNNS
jgi:hypothetical protein|tara:strand:+ start:594 stop:917 length:324 start_codon:yes stop_codon:yes gene_type:complete